MLKSSGESGHPCPVPDFMGNAFNFSPLRIMFSVGLQYMAFRGQNPAALVLGGRRSGLALTWLCDRR